MAATAGSASAQITPAAGYVPPDDTPSIRVGITFFRLTPIRPTPKITDADGNGVNKNNFDIGRAYINVTGQISHLVAFRVTPDIVRESGLITLSSGNTISADSLVYRIKYAYAQFNLDDWMPSGSWARFGIQQTPWVDFEEGILSLSLRGTVFRRAGSAADDDDIVRRGSFVPSNFRVTYGEITSVSITARTISGLETNNQKALELRGTVRPFALGMPILRGIRAHFVYYNDHYQRHDERKRLMGNLTYEQKYINAGFDYLQCRRSTASRSRRKFRVMGSRSGRHHDCHSKTARPGKALLRYDHWIPNTSTSSVPAASSPVPGRRRSSDQIQNRTIAVSLIGFPTRAP
jgi:hypothetical protein